MTLTDSVVYMALAFAPVCTVGLLMLAVRDIRSARLFARRQGLLDSSDPLPAFVRNPPARRTCQVIDLEAHRRI